MSKKPKRSPLTFDNALYCVLVAKRATVQTKRPILFTVVPSGSRTAHYAVFAARTGERSMLSIRMEALPVNSEEARHMHDLWGEEIQTHPSKPPTKARGKPATVPLSRQDCVLFGHTWGAPGFFGEKLCFVCGTKGYCPGCTPLNPPVDARPFFCTTHSQGSVQA